MSRRPRPRPHWYPNPRHPFPYQELYDAHKRMWDEKRRRVRQRKRKVIRPSHTIRGRDLVRALELIRDVTGDPRVDGALRVVDEHGFGEELERTAARVRKETHYTDVQACLGQVLSYTRAGGSVCVVRANRWLPKPGCPGRRLKG